MTDLHIQLEVKEAPMRVDLALLDALQKKQSPVSRAFLKTLFHEKLVLYRKQPIKAAHLLQPGMHEILILNWSPETTAYALAKATPRPEGCSLEIIYEDEDLLVLNKPSGTPSVPHSSSETHTAVNSALAHFPGLAEIGRKGLEPGILHRLDTGTSGLLAFAKTQPTFETLNTAWQDRRIKKCYRAIIEIQPGNPPPQIPLTIQLALAHDARSAKRMLAPESKKFKIDYRGQLIPAISHLTLVIPLTNNLADVEIEIETGVMHQIRCHLSSMGWPILGDPLYRGQPAERLYLHAWKLELPHPKQNKILSLIAPLPEGWPHPSN